MSVPKYDVTTAILSNLRVMGYEDDGSSLTVQFLEQYQYLIAGSGIQITRCLLVDKCSNV